MTTAMNGRYIYVRHTDKDGHTSAMAHLVWNSDVFITSLLDEARKVGGKSNVEQISEEQYRAAR